MLRFHRVPEDQPNPYNQIVFRLPGAQGLRDWMFDKWRATMDEWRRQIHLPPKQSDLWRSAKELNLYGYEDDDDEEELMSGQDSGRKGPGGYSPEAQRIIDALPMSTDDVSAEEQLMLLGMAESEEAAQVMLGQSPRQNSGDSAALIYSAPEIDENPHAENAFQDIADATVQLYESIAAGHSDPSVLKVSVMVCCSQPLLPV